MEKEDVDKKKGRWQRRDDKYDRGRSMSLQPVT